MCPLSVTIICVNEADRIGAALRSVAFAAEIVVVDSGSTDGTVALARQLGARVVETDWPGHVVQKNRAWALATQPWVLSIDADEALSPALAVALEAALGQAADDVGGFEILRVNHYLGRKVRGGVFGPAWHPRLARRDAARWAGEDPHDRLEIRGRIGRLQGELDHTPYRHGGEHLDTIHRYSQRFVEVSLARGRRAYWYDVCLRPLGHLVVAWILRGGLRDGVLGVTLGFLGAAHVALKWGRLYDAQQAAGPSAAEPISR